MKHHCHCGFKKRHQLAKGKRLGLLGITLMVLHLLYHVAECLILPAVFMAWSGHSAKDAIAAEAESPDASEQIELNTEETQKPEAPFSTNLYTDFFETLY